MNDLTQRNVEALAQGLRHLQEQVASNNKAMADLRTELAHMRVRLEGVDVSVNVLKVKSIGRGPTA